MAKPVKTDHDLTRQTLLGLLSRTLFGTPFDPAADVDFTAVYRESLFQTVSLTAFSGRALAVIPPEIRQKFKPGLRPYMMRNNHILAAHTRLDALLTDAHIPYCVIKGVASADYYPEPWLRCMGDVDFYVSPEDMDRAKAVLIAAGFVPEEIDNDHHITLTDRGIAFEMHHEIPGLPGGGEAASDAVRARIQALRADLLSTAKRKTTPNADCILPDTFHHGLILLLHTQQHLLTEGLGLRHLSDWAVFVGSMSADEFITLFRERLTSVGLWRFACLLSLASSRALGLPYAEWMGTSARDMRTADGLVDDFLSGGNFGAKVPDRGRIYESALLPNHTDGRQQKGRIGNGIASLNVWVRHRWPISARCPLLLPFGWIYFAGRRVVLVATGKKKSLHLARAMKGSYARGLVYDELRLFETQK